MKIFAIVDNLELSIGLRLSGIESVVLSDKKEIKNMIEEISNKKDIGVLVVTDNIYIIAEAELLKIKQNKNIPLITKIPNN